MRKRGDRLTKFVSLIFPAPPLLLRISTSEAFRCVTRCPFPIPSPRQFFFAYRLSFCSSGGSGGDFAHNIGITRVTRANDLFHGFSASRTCVEPGITRDTEFSISTSLTFGGLRATATNVRTFLSPALPNANPRSCSPARAASTAAFSAVILVWKAIPSITLVMSTIFPNFGDIVHGAHYVIHRAVLPFYAFRWPPDPSPGGVIGVLPYRGVNRSMLAAVSSAAEARRSVRKRVRCCRRKFRPCASIDRAQASRTALTVMGLTTAASF